MFRFESCNICKDVLILEWCGVDAVFCWNLRKLAKSCTNPSPPSFTIFMAAILSHLTALHILIIAVNPAVSGRLEKNWWKNVIKQKAGNSRANLGIIWAVVAAVVHHRITFASSGEETLWLRNSTCLGIVVAYFCLLEALWSWLDFQKAKKTYIIGRICGLTEAISDSEFQRWRSYLIEW